MTEPDPSFRSVAGGALARAARARALRGLLADIRPADLAVLIAHDLRERHGPASVERFIEAMRRPVE